MPHTLTIKGMHCKSCIVLLTDALNDAGMTTVSISLDEKKQIGTARFEGDKGKAISAINKEGYTTP